MLRWLLFGHAAGCYTSAGKAIRPNGYELRHTVRVNRVLCDGKGRTHEPKRNDGSMIRQRGARRWLQSADYCTGMRSARATGDYFLAIRQI